MNPLAELPLLPEPSHIAVPECHLKIVKADDEVLVVEFPIGNNKQAQRQYILADTRFLVEYPFERSYPHDDSSRWRITVVPSLKSGERIHHDFKNREAAFQFQKYVTGYTPDHYCEKAFCSATIRFRIRKNSPYSGSGEVQLWCPDELCEPTPVGPSDDGYAPSSPSPRGSIGSTATFLTATAVPIFERNNVKTYVNRHRPPLLVALLRDEGQKKYTTLKINRK